MPIKFEWQFKHRDERFLNGGSPHAAIARTKPSIDAGFLHFCGIRFTLPLGDAVTIADRRAKTALHITTRMKRKNGKALPGINRTGKKRGRRQHVRIVLQGDVPELADLQIRSVEERRSLHDQLLCRTAARHSPRDDGPTHRPDVSPTPSSSTRACALVTAPASPPA